ncbi:NADH dehydrogenase (quinone) subunit G, partial [bacterium]
MATVKINGKEITVEEGTLILDAARDAGYEIPTFCYQADLVGIGSCRMCLVEIEGQKKLQPSCVTPVLQGMSILTETPTVMSARASMLEFLLANHALDCPVCDKGGECELQDAVHKYGPHKGRHTEKKFKFHEKDYVLSPVIIKNSNRCVQCLKCVRVCREVVGANVLNGLNRGDHQEATSFLKTFLDCDQDGNCIEVCPVGCFMRLPYRYKVRPWDLKSADTICPYCATGCRMVIEARDGQVVRARAQLGVGINSETLCARGRFGFDFINSPARITAPMIRKFGSLEPVSWEEALTAVKENLGAIPGKKIGLVASPRLTNEELYMFQKLARMVLGSPNIDSSFRWSPEAVESFISVTDMPFGGVSVFDCVNAGTLLIIGGNLTEENPVTDYIVRRVSAQRRMNVIIASVRGMRLDSSANVSVRHLPGAEGALLGAVTAALANQTDDALLKIAGVTTDEVNAMAKSMKASESVAIMAGADFLRFPHGIAGLGALKEALKKSGKKVMIMPALDRANQRGAWEMGVHPGLAPGYRKAEEKGLGSDEMLKGAITGDIEALYFNGADVISGCGDEREAREALSKVKFLVVQDSFMTETAKLAHVVLPSSTFAENDGTLTNQEGRVQLIKRLLPPSAGKSGVGVIGNVGRAFISSFGPKG